MREEPLPSNGQDVIDRETSIPEATALLKERHPEIISLLSGKKLFVFEYTAESPTDLPPGYGFSGGTARAALQDLLGEKVIAPRDLDVIGISEFEPDPELQTELSESLMPEDYEHGYGVIIVSLDDYFATRDFCMNEVLIADGKLICTEEAVIDISEHRIRPTAYEMEQWYSALDSSRYGVKPRLVMKAVRLEAELNEQYGDGTIEGIEDWQWDLREMPLFYIALALDKCQQLGDQIAINFCCLLLDRGVISKESVLDNNGQVYPDQLALNLVIGIGDRRPVVDFTFSNPGLQERINRYLAGGTFEDDLYEYYADLANRSVDLRNEERY